MDTQFDLTLRRLSQGLTHPRLADIELTVLQRIADARAGRAGQWRLDALAFLGALLIGLGGAVAMAAPTAVAATVASLGGISHLAPSSLLERGR